MDNFELEFTPFPTFYSNRLKLRKLSVSDAADMFEYSSRPNVSEYENWKPHKSVAETRDFLKWARRQYFKKKFFSWAIVLNSGKMIGTVSFVKIDCDNRSAEIGYTVSEEYWGNGYAKEAVYQLLRFGFSNLGLNRIYAKVIKGNTRSVRVLEKLGFIYEGTARKANFYQNVCSDLMYFSILSDEFLNIYKKD